MTSVGWIRLIVSIVIAGLFSGCLVDDELNQRTDTYVPQDIQDGLLISSPGRENMDADLLNRIVDDVYADANLWSMRSLLIMRNGRLVTETYLKDPADRTTKHLIWSCTKQVMGILTGIAIDQGLIHSIDDPIQLYLSEELAGYPDKADITIANLLTMRSGLSYDNGRETDELLRQIPGNSLGYIVSTPVSGEPGSVFYYNDGNPHLLSSILQEITGQSTADWADDVFFSKIGVTNYTWERYKDGRTFGGFGIETTPRELAKVALLVANDGQWFGQQVVSNGWIDDMTTPWVQTGVLNYEFGYFWWIDPARDIHFMWGVGGQFAFIVPAKDLVIVMTSFPNTKGDYEIQPDEALEVVDRIVDAAF